MLVYKIHKQIYPATYNFKAEADGTSGTSIGFVDSATTGANTTLQIIGLQNAHRKVLEFYDNDGAARVTAQNNFDDQVSGTVELFVEGSDVNLQFDIRLNHGSTEGPFLFISGDFLRYWDGGSNNIVAVVDSTIYHLRVDFECGAGTYKGLAADTFYVYLNGVRYGPFPFDTGVDHLDNLYMQTSTGSSGYYYYIDAVGYGWDTSYNIGDNVHWRHLKESTDTFETDDVGTTSTSITWVDGVNHADDHDIIAEYNAHKKILRSKAITGTGECYHAFASQATAGWFAFLVKAADVTTGVTFHLREDGTAKNSFQITGSKFQIYTAGAYRDVTNAPVPVNDTWYLIYWRWYADDSFDLWIDNVQYEDGTAARAAQVAGINRIYMDAGADYSYIDAPISSLDSDVRADNRTFDYLPYTYDDITANITNCIVSNKGYDGSTALIHDDTTITVSELHLIQCYDHNGDLRFEGNIKSVDNSNIQNQYPLVSLNNDELTEESSYTASAAEDVNASLLAIHTNISQVDGRLIYYTEDDPAGNLTPNFRNKPKKMGIRWFAIHGDILAPIKANGVFMLDADRTPDAGAATITSTSGEITTPPYIRNSSHQVNYVEVRGAIDPATGTPFSGISQDATAQADGTGIKRYYKRFRELQSDADCANRAAQIRTGSGFSPTIIDVELLGIYAVPGEIINFAYAPLDFTATNCFVEEATYDLGHGTVKYRLNTGIFDIIALNTPWYTEADESSDDINETMFDTDINTIAPHVFASNGATFGVVGINIAGVANQMAVIFFYIDDKVDDSRDMEITFVWQRMDANNDTISAAYALGATKTDGSETTQFINPGGGAGAAITLDACILNAYEKWSITVSAADFDANDIMIARLQLREAGRSIDVTSVIVRYFVKRSV